MKEHSNTENTLEQKHTSMENQPMEESQQPILLALECLIELNNVVRGTNSKSARNSTVKSCKNKCQAGACCARQHSK